MIDLNRQAELRTAIETFFFAYRAFTTPPDRVLAERGLGRVHHRVLYFVGREPGITVTALLAVLGVSKQALNGPLRVLVERGLVATAPDEQDRRVKRLTLTPPGAQLEGQLSGTQMAMLETIFQDAGPAAETAWRAVMARLAAAGESQ